MSGKHSAVSDLGLHCLLRPVYPNTYGKYTVICFQETLMFHVGYFIFLVLLMSIQNICFHEEIWEIFSCIIFTCIINFYHQFSRQQTDDSFLIFFQNIGFTISCRLSPNNFHEMSKPGRKIKMPAAEIFTQHAWIKCCLQTSKMKSVTLIKSWKCIIHNTFSWINKIMKSTWKVHRMIFQYRVEVSIFFLWLLIIKWLLAIPCWCALHDYWVTKEEWGMIK